MPAPPSEIALPSPRGSLSEHVLTTLAGEPGSTPLQTVTPDHGDDEGIALFVLQELRFRRVTGVDPRWESDPSFVALRATLEARLEARLRDRVGPLGQHGSLPDAVGELVDAVDGRSLSEWMLERGELVHLQEFAVHRSAFQLQEADPHTFALPRLTPGSTKAALVEIQNDEYGGTVAEEAHAHLYAVAMAELGVEATDPLDIDVLPEPTIATNTYVHLLTGSRRLAGALLAHLAVFEMTSVEPMARYAATVRKHLDGAQATAAARFFDVHVAADGYHQRLAQDRLLRCLEVEHPDLAADARFGAAGVLLVEQDFADHLLDSWEAGCSSLRTPLAGSPLAPPATLVAAQN